MIKRETFAVASGGTLSDAKSGQGYRLTGLSLPTLDSTTITFSFSVDDTTYRTVYTNSGVTAAVTLGNADTGAKAQAVPDEVGKLSACGFIKLIVAAQTGGARAIDSVWEKVGT